MCQGCNAVRRCRRGLWAAQPPWAPHARLEVVRGLCTAGSAEPLRPPRRSDKRVATPRPARAPSRDVAAAAHGGYSLQDEIADASTVEAVLDVVAKHGLQKLSLWNLTDAIVRLTRLSSELDAAAAQALRTDPRVAELLEGLAPHLAQLPRPGKATSRAFLSAARLGVAFPQPLLDRIWAATGRELHLLPPGAMSYLALGCALLKVKPPDDWLLRFWHGTARALHTYEPKRLGSVLCSVATLRLPPPDYWLARFWRPSAATLRQLDLEHLMPCFHACAKLRVKPPPDWLQVYWRATTSAAAVLPTADLLVVLADCALLGVYPSDEWMDAYFRNCGAKLPQIKEPAELFAVFTACAKLGVTPPPEFMDAFWNACQGKLARGGAEAHVSLITACCRTIDITPPDAILQEYWGVLLGRKPSLSVPVLSEALLSAAVMQLWDAPLLPALFRSLTKAYGADFATWGPPDRFDTFDFYSAYLAACTERPGLLPELRPRVLQSLRTQRRDTMMAPDPATEAMRADIAACLLQLGVEHGAAVWCERSETRVDFALNRLKEAGAEGGAPRVALLLHRPVRTVRATYPPGRMRLRMRLLEAHGWRLAVLSAEQWAKQQTRLQQVGLLQRVLTEAGVM